MVDRIDPEKYDFKPEWENVWAALLKKFYEKDIAHRKLGIKKSLKLPLDKRSPSPIRRKKKVSSQSKSEIPSLLSLPSVKPVEYEYEIRNKRNRYRSPSPVVEDSYDRRTRYNRSPLPTTSSSLSRYREELRREKEEDEQLTREQEKRERHHRHHRHSGGRGHSRSSSSPYHRDNEYQFYADKNRKDYEYEMHNRNERKRSRSRSRNRTRERKHEHERSPRRSPLSRAENHKQSSSESVTVISILRLLTALEDQLGSLGPKAIDLLGKTILYEKVYKFF